MLLDILPQSNNIVACIDGREISKQALLNDVEHLVNRLPKTTYLINLCNNRYQFLVGFFAALLTDKITLLPPNEIPHSLKQLENDYQSACYLYDSNKLSVGKSTIQCHYLGNNESGMPTLDFSIPSDKAVAIVFTSGTTGAPKPSIKTWGSLVTVAQLTGELFGLVGSSEISVIATVPPQHMFGLETSIMLAMQMGLIIDSSRPFFPADLMLALKKINKDALLITTPIHLRAFCQQSHPIKNVHAIISATAHLTKRLANQIEQLFNAPVYEIYGSTETGTLATRRTNKNDYWQLLEGIKLNCHATRPQVIAEHLGSTVQLNDHIQQKNFQHFSLQGRDSDLIKIAGKRASLQALTQTLLNISGVEDGVFFLSDDTSELVSRLTAFVVAPKLTKEVILTELRKSLDTAFLPRPIVFVKQLPRNTLGKLPHDALMTLAKSVANS